MFFLVLLDSDIFKEKIIVPSLWLDKDNTYCLLPPTTDITEVERTAKSQIAPKNGWQMHSVSFMQSFDTYSQAKQNIQKNRKLPEIFELEDEEENQQCHQKGEREVRKRKRPAFLENYSTDMDGEEESRSTVSDNVSVERGISMLHASMIKVEPTEDTTPLESHHQRRKDTSKNLPGSHLQVSQSCSTNEAQTMQRMNTNCPCNSSCHKVILQSLATMQRQIENNSRMLHQIMGRLTGNSGSLSSVNTLPGTPVNFPVTLPMRELSDLQSLNDYLSDQHNFTQTKMNTDPQGKKRGRCLNENCDCSCYEFEKKSGAKCCYCFCPPTQHKKLGVTENTNSNSCSGDTEVITVSSGNDSLQERSCVIDPVPPAASPVITISLPQLQGLLPQKLPKQVEMALESKSLTNLERNRIVRIIADKCFEQNITSKNVDVVAYLAVRKWSPLKSQCGEPAGELALQIKRRMTKLRLNSGKSAISHNSSGVQKKNFKNRSKITGKNHTQNPPHLKTKQVFDATRNTVQADGCNKNRSCTADSHR